MKAVIVLFFLFQILFTINWLSLFCCSTAANLSTTFPHPPYDCLYSPTRDRLPHTSCTTEFTQYSECGNKKYYYRPSLFPPIFGGENLNFALRMCKLLRYSKMEQLSRSNLSVLVFLEYSATLTSCCEH